MAKEPDDKKQITLSEESIELLAERVAEKIFLKLRKTEDDKIRKQIHNSASYKLPRF